MAKLVLKSVEMRNFGTVRNARVEFPKSGFVLVTGHNLTGAGRFDSVGSGKTLLGEAVSRALFNVPGRYTRFSGYSTNGEGDTYVQVVAELEGHQLIVEMGYKCQELSKSGEGLRFTVGTQPSVMYGDIKDTRRELARLVGMSPDVAEWTVYIDGGKLDFNSLSESKSVNLLMGALNQPPWTEYHQKAGRVYDKFKTATEIANGAHTATKQLMDQAQASVELARQLVEKVETEFQQEKLACERRAADRAVKLRALVDESTAVDTTMSRLRKDIELATEAEARQYHEAELAAQRCSSIFAESQRAQVKLEREYGQSTKDHERLKADKQQAINAYTASAYAAANAERNKLVAQARSAEAKTAANRRSWDQQERSLSKAVAAAEVTLNAAELESREATVVHEREDKFPCTCPLPGCGKSWPRTNQAKLESAKQRLESAKEMLATAQANLMVAKAAYEKFALTQPEVVASPEIPTEQTIPPFPDEQAWVDHILASEAEVSAIHSKLSEQTATVALAEAQASDASSKVSVLKQASRVPALSDQYEELERKRGKINTGILELRETDKSDVPDGSAVSTAKAKLEERQSILQQYAEKLDLTAIELTECQEGQKAASYWVEAFGATGIPNMIINEAVAPLNSVSKRVALRMTGGLLDVNYSTTRQLKTGDEKNELVITATNKFGSTQVGGASKGETGLLDLIIAETIAEVGNVSSRVAYRWYDEVATSQDQIVRRSIFTYLKELAQNLGILIFVVDHSTEVSSYADHVLVAEKTDAGTTYSWSH